MKYGGDMLNIYMSKQSRTLQRVHLYVKQHQVGMSTEHACIMVWVGVNRLVGGWRE